MWKKKPHMDVVFTGPNLLKVVAWQCMCYRSMEKMCQNTSVHIIVPLLHKKSDLAEFKERGKNNLKIIIIRDEVFLIFTAYNDIKYMWLQHYRIFLWKKCSLLIYMFPLQGDVVTSCGWCFNLFKIQSIKYLADFFFSPWYLCDLLSFCKEVPHKNLHPGCMEEFLLKATKIAQISMKPFHLSNCFVLNST